MNIDLLNSGDPSQKSWLNPVCGTLRCNNLIAGNINPDPLDSSFYTNTNAILNVSLLQVTNGLDKAIVGNPNYNTLTNVFTVASIGVYYISVSLSVTTNVIGNNNNRLSIIINGVQIEGGTSWNQSSVPATASINTTTASILVPLSPGNTIGFQMNCTATDPNALVDISGSSFLVQKL